MGLRSPLAEVRGLGSAKEGPHHWWWQRLTAVALIPLCIWFIYSLLSVVTVGDHAVMLAWFANPINALLMVAFVVAVFYHSALGMQVIIEDYASTERMKLFMLLSNKTLMFFMALASVFAIVKLHFLNVITSI